jgi:hypothetical protein
MINISVSPDEGAANPEAGSRLNAVSPEAKLAVVLIKVLRFEMELGDLILVFWNYKIRRKSKTKGRY